MHEAVSGDTVLVAPGTYTESVRVARSGISLLGNGPSAADTRIQPPTSADGVFVAASDVRIENFWIAGGRRGIASMSRASGLRIDHMVVTSTRVDGMTLLGNDVQVTNSIITGAGRAGVYARLTNSVIHNCFIYANRKMGVFLPSSSIEVRFATIYANGREGVRAMRGSLDVNHSIINSNLRSGIALVRPDTAPQISYSIISANSPDLSPASTALGGFVQLGADPLFVDPVGADLMLGGAHWADDRLSLWQVAAGQSVTSPAVDAGQVDASAAGVLGSTASNGLPDSGKVDLGAHR